MVNAGMSWDKTLFLFNCTGLIRRRSSHPAVVVRWVGVRRNLPVKFNTYEVTILTEVTAIKTVMLII